MANPPPGTELDALVAKAMGQDVRRVPDGRGGLEWEMRDPGGDWVAVPAYSTAGNGMLAMLEWMRAQAFSARFFATTNGALVSRRMQRNSKSRPHAVALALLAAVKAEKEKTA